MPDVDAKKYHGPGTSDRQPSKPVVKVDPDGAKGGWTGAGPDEPQNDLEAYEPGDNVAQDHMSLSARVDARDSLEVLNVEVLPGKGDPDDKDDKPDDLHSEVEVKPKVDALHLSRGLEGSEGLFRYERVDIFYTFVSLRIHFM